VELGGVCFQWKGWGKVKYKKTKIWFGLYRCICSGFGNVPALRLCSLSRKYGCFAVKSVNDNTRLMGACHGAQRGLYLRSWYRVYCIIFSTCFHPLFSLKWFGKCEPKFVLAALLSW
jgi:hypothetical protein